MFGISFSEIILILIIALIIFGPEQLPVIARKTGKVVASIRNLTQNLRTQIYENTGIEQIQLFKSELEHHLEQVKSHLSHSNSKIIDYALENDASYQKFEFLYQPELDFNRQPELFDE